MYMYACMYVCLHTYIAAYIHSYIHTKLHTYIVTYIYTHKHKLQETRVAAIELQRHMRAVATQLAQSLSLVMPLARYASAHPQSDRAAARIQGYMRVWCMQHLGLRSAIDFVGVVSIDARNSQGSSILVRNVDENSSSNNNNSSTNVIGAHSAASSNSDSDFSLEPSHKGPQVGRLHLSHTQKRDAIIEIQRSARMVLAFTEDVRIRPSGYSAVLLATITLQSHIRACLIRNMMQRLTEQYGLLVLQAQARMYVCRGHHMRMVSECFAFICLYDACVLEV